MLLRIRQSESGFTLIELMLTATILAVVLGAILAVSDKTAQLAPNDDERALLMQETRTGLRGITRELRHATAVGTVGSYSLSFNIGTRAITYACTEAQPGAQDRTRCTRSEGTGPAVPVINHVLNPKNSRPVFVRSGGNVSVTVQVAAAGDRPQGHRHPITLSGGAYMRNLP